MLGCRYQTAQDDVENSFQFHVLSITDSLQKCHRRTSSECAMKLLYVNTGWARTFGSIGKGQQGSEGTRKKGAISSGKGLYSDENKGIPSTKASSKKGP